MINDALKPVYRLPITVQNTAMSQIGDTALRICPRATNGDEYREISSTRSSTFPAFPVAHRDGVTPAKILSVRSKPVHFHPRSMIQRATRNQPSHTVAYNNDRIYRLGPVPMELIQ